MITDVYQPRMVLIRLFQRPPRLLPLITLPITSLVIVAVGIRSSLFSGPAIGGPYGVKLAKL